MREANRKPTIEGKSPSSNRSRKISNLITSRGKLILQLIDIIRLHFSKEENKPLIKGIDWLKNELYDSLMFKFDESTLAKINKLKTENQDMKYIVSWIEEYSTIKLNAQAKKQFNDNLQTSKRKSIININEIKDILVNKRKSQKLKEKKENQNFSNNSFDSNGLEKSQNENSINSDEKEEEDLKSSSYKTLISLGVNQIINVDKNIMDFNSDLIEHIEDEYFNIFNLDKQVGRENTLGVIGYYIFNLYGFYSLINYTAFENFINEISAGYIRENPYHNDLHAGDVTQTCLVFMKKGKVNDLVNLDIYNLCALFISCMVHDFKHPGLTNAFLVNTNDEIAIRYNDKSVLESYHIAQTFELIKNKPKCDIFKDMNKSEIAMMRKRMINCVLSTDMVKHAEIFSLIKVSTEKYKINQGKNANKFFDGLESMALYDMQQNFMDLFIHSCDISNPTKPYDIYQIWASNVMNEFYLQGDKEKKLGLPVSFLCDRDTTTIPQGQIGFMEGVVLPFYSSVVNIFPGLDYSIKNLNYNKTEFIKLKEQYEKEKEKKTEDEKK